jgi:hypothetical protein
MQVQYKYSQSSHVNHDNHGSTLSFSPDLKRHPTFFHGVLNKKLPFREAISALHAVVMSDLRFKPKDKTAYLEWAASQEKIWLAEYLESLQIDNVKQRLETVKEELKVLQSEKNKALGPFNKAKLKYFDYLYSQDKEAWIVLDPVISVHPDEVFFECFSQDESTYAKLSTNYNVYDQINEKAYGTTNIDYSLPLYNEFQKVRQYKETVFKIDPTGFEAQTTNEQVYKEPKIDLPDSWIRGFLQVSSAMVWPQTTFDLHPMDMYSILSFMKQYREKDGPRALRFILKPGEPIEVVFEPCMKSLVFHRSIYEGAKSETIRIWGRRRLHVLERLLPITKKIKTVLLGHGLPSFFVAEMDDMQFTLGLSGWTTNDWSNAGKFDLLVPRESIDYETQAQVFTCLQQKWFASADDLSKTLKLDKSIINSALTAFIQSGKVVYDLYNQVYRVRELINEPLDMNKLRFSSDQEKIAQQLIDQNLVHTKQSVVNKQLEVNGHLKDKQKAQTKIILNADFQTVEATCNCSFFRNNQLKKGPCEHILATRRMVYLQKR